MKKYGVAICGCESHVEKFGLMVNGYEESQMTGCWDPERSNAERVAAAVGCKVYDSFEEIMADPKVDGIILVTVNKRHADCAVRAAECGKHIFIEHPLCLEMEDAKHIRDAVQKSGVKFFMSDPMVNAGTQYLKKAVAEGRIGKVVSVMQRSCSTGGPLSHGMDREKYEKVVSGMGGGQMANTGLHPFHIVQYLLGKPLSAHAIFHYSNPVARECGYEEHNTVLFEYPNEVTAMIETSIMSPSYLNMTLVTGTDGMIVERTIGGNHREVYIRLPQPDEQGRGGNRSAMADPTRWQKIPDEEIGPDPKDHVRYWVEMMAYNYPNDQVGTDPYSTHGISIDNAVELVAMRNAVIAAEKRGGVPVEY